jgi:hypothetical protein
MSPSPDADAREWVVVARRRRRGRREDILSRESNRASDLRNKQIIMSHCPNREND